MKGTRLKRQSIDLDILKKEYSYDPETGNFLDLKKGCNVKGFVKSGKWYIRHDKKQIQAQLLVAALSGYDASRVIVIALNGDYTDVRIENLIMGYAEEDFVKPVNNLKSELNFKYDVWTPEELMKYTVEFRANKYVYIKETKEVIYVGSYLNKRHSYFEVTLPEGYKCESQWVHILEGNIKNPYRKDVYGVGYMGEGIYVKHKGRFGKRSLHTREYNMWSSMIQRCSTYVGDSYENATISDEWLNFQNFAKWYHDNVYSCEHPLHLEKDVLVLNNKHYSAETCILVPDYINRFCTKPSQRLNYTFYQVVSKSGEISYSHRSSTVLVETNKDLNYLIKKRCDILYQRMEDYLEKTKGDIPVEVYNQLKEYNEQCRNLENIKIYIKTRSMS